MNQAGVREPDSPVTVTVSRAQAWTIYDLLVAKAVVLEANEDEARCHIGSRKYRDAANEVLRQLDAAQTVPLKETGL